MNLPLTLAAALKESLFAASSPKIRRNICLIACLEMAEMNGMICARCSCDVVPREIYVFYLEQNIYVNNARRMNMVNISNIVRRICKTIQFRVSHFERLQSMERSNVQTFYGAIDFAQPRLDEKIGIVGWLVREYSCVCVCEQWNSSKRIEFFFRWFFFLVVETACEDIEVDIYLKCWLLFHFGDALFFSTSSCFYQHSFVNVSCFSFVAASVHFLKLGNSGNIS